MSTFITVLCILLPIVLVIVWSSISIKRKKKKAEESRFLYYKLISEETGIAASSLFNLVGQLIVLDETAKRLLIIDQKNNSYEHCLFRLDEIKNIHVSTIKKVIEPAGKGGKMENFTDKVVLEIIPGKNGEPSKQIIFYDRARHSIYEMTRLQKEAEGLREKILESKRNRLTVI